MKIAFFIYGFDSKNFAPSIVSAQECIPDSSVYAATTDPKNWEILSSICTPCCGNPVTRQEETAKYTLKSLNNITALKFSNKSDLFGFISEIKDDSDIIVIMRSGSIFGADFSKVVSEFHDSNIGCVYPNGSDVYRSISPIQNFDYDVDCIAARSKLIPSQISALKDIIVSAYQKSIVKHIPERLYESLYQKN